MKVRISKLMILCLMVFFVSCESKNSDEDNNNLLIDNLNGTRILYCNNNINILTVIDDILCTFESIDYEEWNHKMISSNINPRPASYRPYGCLCNNDTISLFYINEQTNNLYYISNLQIPSDQLLLLSGGDFSSNNVAFKQNNIGEKYIVVLDNYYNEEKVNTTIVRLYKIMDNQATENVLALWENSLNSLVGMTIGTDNVIHIMIDGQGQNNENDSDESEQLMHIYGKDDNWQMETLDDTVHAAFDVDDNNNIHLFYVEHNEEEGTNPVKYKIKSNGIWQEQELGEHTQFYFFGYYSDMVAKDNGIIHILGYNYKGDDPSDEHGLIYYLTNKSGSWERTTVEEDYEGVGEHSFDVDENNNVHISYFRNTDKKLIYATNQSGQWEYYPVEL